jgi:hypothetical protein
MRQLQKLTGLLAAGLFLSGFCISVFGQDQDEKKQPDGLKQETTMTGCLTKDASGNYTLTDEKTAAKMTVTGPSDLEKHSAGHKVTLTGTTKTDASGNSAFEVSKIKHVSATCKAPSQ